MLALRDHNAVQPKKTPENKKLLKKLTKQNGSDLGETIT